MTTLYITRGLPGSGKTTFARRWVAEDPATRARVNRDDIRQMLDNGDFIKGVTEARVLAVRNAAISALLRKGVSVINDDTNLPQRVARDLARIATHAGAEFVVIDMTDVPLQTCIDRDEARDKNVGEKIIRDLHKRYLAGKDFPLPLPTESVDTSEPTPYSAPADRPRAVMVDIDGTVALMCDRSPYDGTRVSEDLPNKPVIDAVHAMHAAGSRVIFVTARSDEYRDVTEAWLREHVALDYDALYMRAAGDMRKDSLVKSELFDKHIRYDYNVVCVFDDRKQVVDMWRKLGLTVFQVAEGDF